MMHFNKYTIYLISASPVIDFKVNFDVTKKGNKEYITPTSNTFDYTISRAYFQLENLFNGDERLGKNSQLNMKVFRLFRACLYYCIGKEMSLFLNENWKEVNDEIGKKVAEAIGEVLMQVLANFFKKVSINEIFDN